VISKAILTTLFILLSVGSVPFAFASSSTQLTLTTVGSSVIDLKSPEQDRILQVYAQFVDFDIIDFDINDGSFLMKVIEESTGKQVFDSTIYVASTATGLVSFNSHVFYLITNDVLENNEVTPGSYLMQVFTKDGSVVESIPFSVI